MMRSLYSGVSGLRNHQTRMDVIGNNISNVNTAGFKSSRVIFQDVYSQTSSNASAGMPGITGGTNAKQIGLGVKLAAIDVMHMNAATQRTDNPTDLAIEGDGFFIIGTTLDYNSATGAIDGVKETQYTRAGNMYMDNAGNLVTANGQYLVGVMLTQNVDASGTITTDPSTKPASPLAISDFMPLNVSGFTGVAIDSSGTITGLNDKMERVEIGYIPLATFTNTPGLEKQGDSLYSSTPNSGAPFFTYTEEGAAGKIAPGGLEMSNVDLSAEFTDMIVTQRGFQANSRVITTSDSLLEELVNLKR